MALIKCSECEKEISDKAEVCPNCGCPVNKKNKSGNFGINFWLIVCIITCALISLVEIFDLLDIDRNIISIGNFDFSIVGYLAILLGFSYISLIKNKNKISYYVILGVNIVILLYNIFNVTIPINFKSGLALLYIVCVFLNSLITTLVVRKHLNNDKFLISKNKLLIIFFAITLIVLLILESTFKPNFSQTNFRDESVNQVRIVNDYIYIRKGKSVDSDILGKVYKDEIYTILNEEVNENEWLEIETTNGINGYIYALPSYVEILRVSEEEEEEEEEEIDDTVNEENKQEKPSTNQNNNSSVSKPSTNNNSSNNKDEKPIKDEDTGNIVEKPNSDDQVNNNDSNSTGADENLNNKVEDSKEEEIIDATLEYYCTSPFKLNGKVCEKIEYSGIEAKKTCSFGYVMSEDGKKCIGETREDKDYTSSPTCVGGSVTDLFSMTAPPYYGCRKGTLTFERTCPRGYTLITAMNISKCVWDYTGKETYVSSNCSSTYPVFDTDSGQCVNRTVKSAYTKYTCPDGYVLKQDKCHK